MKNIIGAIPFVSGNCYDDAYSGKFEIKYTNRRK